MAENGVFCIKPPFIHGSPDSLKAGTIHRFVGGRACSCGHRQQFSSVKFYILGERHTYRPHEVSQVKQVTNISQISYCHLHSHVSDSPIFDHYLLFFKQESRTKFSTER